MQYAVQEVRNSKNEPIVLNEREYALCQSLQAQYDSTLKNSLGFDLNITTMTAISKKVVEQKFFEIAPSDFMPVKVGDNAWASQITTYREFSVGDDFEKGILNTGGSQTRLAAVGTAIDSLSIQTVPWAKEIHWAIPELKQAQFSGNWDLITAKERSRKKNWDLGIQKIAFLGSATNTSILGLFTQTTVNSNTSLITKKISSMTDLEFQTLVTGLLEAYHLNANRTQMPTHFIIPQDDYNGLVTPVNVNFAMSGSKLEYLQKALAAATGNSNFKILGNSYAMQSNNTAVINKNRYVLLNYDEDSVNMNIPVQYTNTQQNSINGFQFQNVGYGQFTGVLAYRPLEMLYLDWNV